MELLTYLETVAVTGIDPAADPDLPDLPAWIEHPPLERVADMDTATIPVVKEVPVSTDQVLMIARMLGAAGGASQAGASEEEIAAAIDAAEEVAA